MRHFLACLVALVGCGKVTANGRPDGGVGDIDGRVTTKADAAAPDAISTTIPILGVWDYVLDPTSTNPTPCTVTITPGKYDILCPQTGSPPSVSTNCTKTKDDTDLNGTLDTQFNGTWNRTTHYTGTGCTDAGYASDVDIPDLAFVIMGATKTALGTGPGFWQGMYGTWGWGAYDATMPASAFLNCNVTFKADTTGAHSIWQVLCPAGTSTSVGSPCDMTDYLDIQGSVDGTTFTGTAQGETHYDGTGCAAAGYPTPVVNNGTPDSMTATKR
jgi:hypothetical protein